MKSFDWLIFFPDCIVDWIQSFLSKKCLNLDNITLTLFSFTATWLVCCFCQFEFPNIWQNLFNTALFHLVWFSDHSHVVS